MISLKGQFEMSPNGFFYIEENDFKILLITLGKPK